MAAAPGLPAQPLSAIPAASTVAVIPSSRGFATVEPFAVEVLPAHRKRVRPLFGNTAPTAPTACSTARPLTVPRCDCWLFHGAGLVPRCWACPTVLPLTVPRCGATCSTVLPLTVPRCDCWLFHGAAADPLIVELTLTGMPSMCHSYIYSIPGPHQLRGHRGRTRPE